MLGIFLHIPLRENTFVQRHEEFWDKKTVLIQSLAEKALK